MSDCVLMCLYLWYPIIAPPPPQLLHFPSAGCYQQTKYLGTTTAIIIMYLDLSLILFYLLRASIIICFLRVGYFWFHSSLIIVDHLLYSSFVTRRILNLQPRVSPRPPSTTTPLSLPPPPRLLLLFCKPTTIYIPVVP